MEENLVDLEFEIDTELYEEVVKLCDELGTTIEDVALQFVKFCAVPENLPKVKEILGIE